MNLFTSILQIGSAFLLGLGLTVGIGVVAEAAKVFVASNGLDSAACGEKDDPCRTLNQAIANAQPGDKIIVGPGRYGDLNEDGTIGNSSGEEDPPAGCNCVIEIGKVLSFESRDGAQATVLDGGTTGLNVVRITASGVIFGKKKKKGFIITRGANGIDTDLAINTLQIIGNIAINNSLQGFRIDGGIGHVVTENVSSGNNIGFRVEGSNNKFSNNLAISNTLDGFVLLDTNSVATGNVSSRNGKDGFNILTNNYVLTGNISAGNSGSGFNISSGIGHILTGNAALVNQFQGIFLDTGSNAVITKNNLFGNKNNCGVRNRSENTINATNNFWGASTGPGNDPADKAGSSGPGGSCDGNPGSLTNFAPFATKEFKIKIKINGAEIDSAELEQLIAPQQTPKLKASSAEFSLYSLRGQLLTRFSHPSQLTPAKIELPNGIYLAVKIYADGRRTLEKFVVRR